VKLSFSDSAIVDLQNIRDFYLQEGAPEVGENFIVAIFKHVETLIDHPDIGRIVPEFEEQHIRELIHPPFRIVYLREVKAIQIVRVWRSQRLLNLP
jgi:plasmid stabilization system protein ParE